MDKNSRIKLTAPQILSIFESVPGLYLILKPNAPRFTIVAVSNAYAEATMTKRKKIIGKGLFEVFPDNPNDPNASGVKNLTASLMQVLKNKKPHKMDIQKYDIPHPKDGFEERYWSPLNVPVLNDRGEVYFIVHSVLDVTSNVMLERKEKAAQMQFKKQQAKALELEADITERRKMEESLRRLAEIVESSDDAIISKSSDGTILSWNRGAEHLYGYSAKEIIGKPISTLMPANKKNDFPKIMQALQKGKRVDHYETQRMSKDGRIIDVAITVSPIKDENGKIIGASKIARDITEKKQYEENLKFLSEASRILASSLDYQKTLNSITKLAVPEIADWCAVDLLNSKGELEQVAIAHKNPSKVKWAKALRKADPPDLNAPRGVPHVLKTGKAEFYPFITDEMITKLAKNKKQLQLLRQVGFTSAMIVPLFIKGKTVGGISFVTTETKRQFTESDLIMAQEIASRASLALENAGLYRASQEAVSLRDNFISIASHELKTPVTSVKIFTQVLQQHSEQIGDEEAKKHLTKMDKQLNKLIELIYNLLNISKIQAGRMEFSQKLFDFDSSIKEIIEVLQDGIPKHKLIIKGQTGKKIYGDEDRIGQVVSNLVSNAIKYSPKAGKVIIHLSSDRNFVKVCIEDFGIGMAKEHLSKIFERFYRVFDTTDKTFPGLGIGLYISAEIIKRHHGKLWVESDSGKGSRFYFVLPLKRDKKPNGIHIT
jgi:PAS domain S-box-containing protein